MLSKLLLLCEAINHATEPTGKLKALKDLHSFLNETPPLDLFLGLELALHDQEKELSEAEKQLMRQFADYQFPEDLENVPEMNLGGYDDEDS